MITSWKKENNNDIDIIRILLSQPCLVFLFMLLRSAPWKMRKYGTNNNAIGSEQGLEILFHDTWHVGNALTFFQSCDLCCPKERSHCEGARWLSGGSFSLMEMR